MAIWTITNQHKKSAIEIMFFYKDGRVIKKEEGFRWGRWHCESDTKPEIDLVNEDGFEVGGDYDWEMDEMIDGCWSDWTYPDDMTDEEREAFEAAWEENWYEGVEALGWSQDDCEMWIYGPIQMEDEQGNIVGQGEPDEEIPPMPEPPNLSLEEKVELIRELEEEKSLLTPWYPASINPVRNGTYQVLHGEYEERWPFPSNVRSATWDGSKWNDEHVVQWRGLTEEVK